MGGEDRRGDGGVGVEELGTVKAVPSTRKRK